MTTCESVTHEYHPNCAWRRPGGYEGPRTTYTEILRACQSIYQEVWTLVCEDVNLTLYFTGHCLRPARCMNPYTFRRLLAIFNQATGRNLLIRHLQIFSGTQYLGKDFFDIVRHPFVTLRAVTITVRYIDNQGWQDGSTLVANGDFVEEWQIPHAVLRITIEFENLLTRRHDVDRLVKEAAIKWRFRRQEGNNP